jgi:predicted PurR-regulated permease PerM
MRATTAQWVARGAGLALGAGLVVLLGLVFVRSAEIVLLVFISILLGAALEPVVAWLRLHARLRRGPAILIVYAAFFAAVVAIAIVIVPAALVQMSTALRRLPTFLENVRHWSATLRPESVKQGVSALVDAAEEPLKPGQPLDPDAVVNASLIAATATAALLTLLALVFFWLTERSRLQRYALAFIPLERRGGVRDAWNEIEGRLGLWVRGQLFLMSVIGVGTAAAYWVIGLPAALLLGLIAGIAEAIPIAGPVIGAIPALLIATTISPQTVIVTLAVYVVLQLLEGNVLVPMVMRNTVGLSPFLVLVTLLVGGAVAGIPGAIVAVPLVAGAAVILERLQVREVPVPVDPSSEQTPTEADRADLRSISPDAPGGARAGGANR